MAGKKEKTAHPLLVLRKRKLALYFSENAVKKGEYAYYAGEWYDGVPEEHFDKFIKQGIAQEVVPEEDGCGLGCMVTKDTGEAVSVRRHPEGSPYAFQDCVIHEPEALRPAALDGHDFEWVKPNTLVTRPS